MNYNILLHMEQLKARVLKLEKRSPKNWQYPWQSIEHAEKYVEAVRTSIKKSFVAKRGQL